MKISVIIPCFNEIDTISEVISKVKQAETGQNNQKEIIIVDDGSTDGTRDWLRKLTDDFVKVILKESNSGKGASLREGIKAASGEIIIFQDADLEYHPNQYPKLLSAFSGDCVSAVYGSRFIGADKNKIPFITAFVNKVLNIFFNILYPTNLTDLETGQKAIRADLLKSLALRSSGFDIEVEITAKLVRRMIKIVEVPISYYPRSVSQGKKMSYLREGWRAATAAIRYRFFN